MQSKVPHIPAGHNAVSPYLIVDGASRAIEFYKKAFGATEIFRLNQGPEKVMHAEIKIGDSVIMLTDECPEMDARGPQSIGGSPVLLHVYVPDVDARVKQAVDAGATLVRPVEDQFYGSRSGGVKDPFGYTWYFATQKEILTEEEISRRATAFQKPAK